MTGDVRRAFGLRILTSRHRLVRRLKRAGHAPEIHGNKLWFTSYLLMDYLRRNPPGRRQRIMEIGCGWGLPSIYCAKRFGSKVTAVDADRHVFPYLDLHAEVNGVEIDKEQNSFERLTVARLQEVDLLIGADICFWDHMTDTLYNLIRRSLRAGVEKIVIADPCRSPFADLTERCEARLAGAETLAVEVRRPIAASGQLLVINGQE